MTHILLRVLICSSICLSIGSQFSTSSTLEIGTKSRFRNRISGEKVGDSGGVPYHEAVGEYCEAVGEYCNATKRGEEDGLDQGYGVGGCKMRDGELLDVVGVKRTLCCQ